MTGNIAYTDCILDGQNCHENSDGFLSQSAHCRPFRGYSATVVYLVRHTDRLVVELDAVGSERDLATDIALIRVS